MAFLFYSRTVVCPMFTGMCGFHEKLAFHYFHGEFLFASCCYIDDVNAARQQIDVYVLLSLCQVYTLLHMGVCGNAAYGKHGRFRVICGDNDTVVRVSQL